MGLEALKAIKDEYQAKVKVEGEAALKDHFKTFFAENPKILGVRWTQYAPYFNDGDPCVFSVHGVYAKMDGIAEDAGDYDDGFESDYGLRKLGHEDEAKSLAALEGILGDMEDVLESVLGENSKITITPDKVEIEEYEHD